MSVKASKVTCSACGRKYHGLTPCPLTPERLWSLEDLKAAKRLIRWIVRTADIEGTLRPCDVKSVIAAAREIRESVERAERMEGLNLPL